MNNLSIIQVQTENLPIAYSNIILISHNIMEDSSRL